MLIIGCLKCVSFFFQTPVVSLAQKAKIIMYQKATDLQFWRLGDSGMVSVKGWKYVFVCLLFVCLCGKLKVYADFTDAESTVLQMSPAKLLQLNAKVWNIIIGSTCKCILSKNKKIKWNLELLFIKALITPTACPITSDSAVLDTRLTENLSSMRIITWLLC